MAGHNYRKIQNILRLILHIYTYGDIILLCYTICRGRWTLKRTSFRSHERKITE